MRKLKDSMVRRPGVPPTSRVQHRWHWTHLSSTATLAYWQLRQTWRLLLVTSFGMVAAIVLVCAVPLYSQVTTTAGLRSTLASLGDNADITVRSTAQQISLSAIQSVQQELNKEVQQNLGPYLGPSPQFSVSTAGIPFHSQDSSQRGNQIELLGSAMQQVSPHLQLIQGRLPRTMSKTVEIVLTPDTARSLQVNVGTILNVSLLYDNTKMGRLERILPLTVVGLFAPHLNDPFWHGNDFAAMPLGESYTIYSALVSNEAFLSALTRIASASTFPGPGTLRNQGRRLKLLLLSSGIIP